MSRISDNTFITVQSFMVTDLKLSGNELLVYAVIYGFSQDGESWFNGSVGYLAEWCNSSKQSIHNVLKKLLEKGLIEKEDVYINNVKYCKYRVSINFIGVVKKVDRGVVNKVDRGSQQSLHNNIDNKIDSNNIDIYKTKKTKKEFIPPTVDEVKSYCQEKGYNVDSRKFVEYYSSNNWKDKNDKPVKNWKLKLLCWNGNSQKSSGTSLISKSDVDKLPDDAIIDF